MDSCSTNRLRVTFTRLMIVLTLTLSLPLTAGPLRERMSAVQDELALDDDPQPFLLPDGIKRLSNLSYGGDARQRLDVYLPANPNGAPILLMVHGGAWMLGDKASKPVVENKIRNWVARGFILASVNYRLLPKAGPQQQAEDVARALAFTQAEAAKWGGDPSRVILMGHSAGAHLVALLGAAPSVAFKFGCKPWLGTIALDSAAMDVARIMSRQHLHLYDRVFAGDKASWESLSPSLQIGRGATPILAVCSKKRTDSCAQAQGLREQGLAHGIRVEVLEEPLSHKDINALLGQAGPYTTAVETFILSLDSTMGKLLTKQK